MANASVGTHDGSGDAKTTREVTITVRNDISDADVHAQTKQLAAGTNNFVTGSIADLQRMGAAEVAKNGGQNTAAVFQVNPNVDADAAKAGAQRTLDEEKAVKEMGAELAATAAANDGSNGNKGDADADVHRADTGLSARKK